ncbi:MAG: ATP-binding protein [Candidatus Aenigmarchaeota archaeon]|nr:ATP-binding protein [Candidatus Aenigmarchaeota archaeon]
MYETIVGRTKEDLEKFGSKATGYIGKHIVGMGEDAHLTTKVFLDLLRPHVILICGKRGSGKSYDAGVIAEEIASLPEEFRQNLAVVMIDTMGIFWSLKRKNEQQINLLREWELEPKGFGNVKVFVPFLQIEEFQRAGIPVDAGISILPYEFSGEEWCLAFNLKRTDAVAISLEKNVNELLETREKFTIEDLITKIRGDKETSQDTKNALENMLRVANRWGVFGVQGINIDEIVQPGQISVVDVSHLRATEAWSVRNFIVAILARKIYQERVIARKEEEIAKMEGAEIKKKFPMVWLIIDEAHVFCPAEFETVSSQPLLTIAKQGREPGISLVVITQMPSKVHQDILSQCDLVISHRLTSKNDLQALHTVYQVYMAEEIEKFINRLPRWPGSAIILDDNLEKVFTVQIRSRLSHHAGGTAALL